MSFSGTVRREWTSKLRTGKWVYIEETVSLSYKKKGDVLSDADASTEKNNQYADASTDVLTKKNNQDAADQSPDKNLGPVMIIKYRPPFSPINLNLLVKFMIFKWKSRITTKFIFQRKI